MHVFMNISMSEHFSISSLENSLKKLGFNRMPF